MWGQSIYLHLLAFIFCALPCDIINLTVKFGGILELIYISDVGIDNISQCIGIPVYHLYSAYLTQT